MQTLSMLIPACMSDANGMTDSRDGVRAAVGCERARIYNYLKPARSTGREKDAFVCGAWRGLVGLAEECWDGNEGGLV